MKSEIYVCPMHPSVAGEKGDKCRKCGMELVPREKVEKPGQNKVAEHRVSFWQTYKPLFVIVGFILLPVLVLAITDIQASQFEWGKNIRHFMAGFFLVFSGFKFLDLKGFAQGYFTYDLLARRWFTWGYIYPFLELALGLSYMTGNNLLLTNWATLILMSFSGIGVVNEVLKGKKVKCVCLGTVIDVPLTTVTIIEDFGMAVMALVMLLFSV